MLKFSLATVITNILMKFSILHNCYIAKLLIWRFFKGTTFNYNLSFKGTSLIISGSVIYKYDMGLDLQNSIREFNVTLASNRLGIG